MPFSPWTGRGHQARDILVDTKYEFGLGETTYEIMFIDEIHTDTGFRELRGPDGYGLSLRMTRSFFGVVCVARDPHEILPALSTELVNELSRRYIMIFETLLGSLQFQLRLGGIESQRRCNPGGRCTLI